MSHVRDQEYDAKQSFVAPPHGATRCGHQLEGATLLKVALGFDKTPLVGKFFRFRVVQGPWHFLSLCTAERFLSATDQCRPC